jgi:sugar O-acyltransferase (sialic acid O-acetyltransferase NeuD family)
MRPVVIYGVGSPLAIDAEESCTRLGVRVVAAIRNVDGPSHVTDSLTVVAVEDATTEMKACGIILPMFTPAHRKQALEDARKREFSLAETIIDPTSIIAKSTTVGAGVYVNAGCTLGGGGEIGDFVLINRGANIGHHARLAAFVSIGPGAVVAGGVRIGRGAVIGAGAVVLPTVEIGANAVVGAGAVVTKSVAPNCVVVGNPARIAKTGVSGYNDRGV